MKRLSQRQNQSKKQRTTLSEFWKPWISKAASLAKDPALQKRISSLPDCEFGYAGQESSLFKKYVKIKRENDSCLVLVPAPNGPYFTYGSDAILLELFAEHGTFTSLGVAIAAKAYIAETLDSLIAQGLDVIVGLENGYERITMATHGGLPLIGLVKSEGGYASFRIYWGKRIELLSERPTAEEILAEPHAQPVFSFCKLHCSERVIQLHCSEPQIGRCAKIAAAAYASELRVELPPMELIAQQGSWLPWCTRRELCERLPLVDYVLPRDRRSASEKLIQSWLTCPPPEAKAEIISALIQHWSSGAAPPLSPLPARFGLILDFQENPYRQSNNKRIDQLLQVQRLTKLALLYRQLDALPLLSKFYQHDLPDLSKLDQLLEDTLLEKHDPLIPPSGCIPDDYWINLDSSALFRLLKIDCSELDQAVLDLDQAAQSLKIVTNKNKLNLGCKRGPLQHPVCKSLQTTETLLAAETRLIGIYNALEEQAEEKLRCCSALITAQRHQLQQAWNLILLAQTTYEHACHAAQRGWHLAQRGREFHGEIWPYYRKLNDTVKWPIKVSGVMFLTGCNQGGKSTLLRSVAAVAVLASCGLAVPGKVSLPRYDTVFLRTCSQDQPLEGKSSFRLEAEDIVLGLSAKNSLFLGDELGRGTDVQGGMATTLAILDLQLRRSAHTIFSTHLWQAAEKLGTAKVLLECYQLDRQHQLSRGICRSSLTSETLEDSNASPEFMDRFRHHLGTLPLSDPAKPCPPLPRFPSIPPPIPFCPSQHPALLLLAEYVGEAYWVDHDQQVPAFLMRSHVLYLRLDPQRENALYFGESKNLRKRAAQHRQGRCYSFAVWPQPDQSQARRYEQRFCQQFTNLGYYVESKEANKDF
jgi:hypothetical protein